MDREEYRRTYPDRNVRQEGDGLGDDFAELSKTVRPEGEEEFTRQSELDAADINKIVSRFELAGVMPLSSREGLYIDVSEVGDYRSALEQINKVNDYFMTLPASSRALFNNDPAEFLDKVNAGEGDLLVKAGVIPAGEVRVPEGGAGAPDAAPVS